MRVSIVAASDPSPFMEPTYPLLSRSKRQWPLSIARALTGMTGAEPRPASQVRTVGVRLQIVTGRGDDGRVNVRLDGEREQAADVVARPTA
jgi:hypothetical protein